MCCAAHFANPSSLYTPGFHSETVLVNARAAVAASLGAAPAQIIFTASGSEGNNLAVFGAAKARSAWANHIVVTGYAPQCAEPRGGAAPERLEA